MQRRDTYGDPTLSVMPSSRYWECLDIAGPTTLGALNRSALNYWCPTPTDCAWTFEALTSAQTTSNTLFGGTATCDDKVVGDGTVNSLDIAVLMYAQFGEGPYEHIFLPGQEPGRFNPRTTYGRERTQHQCGNGMLPNQYQLQLSTDYCEWTCPRIACPQPHTHADLTAPRLLARRLGGSLPTLPSASADAPHGSSLGAREWPPAV